MNLGGRVSQHRTLDYGRFGSFVQESGVDRIASRGTDRVGLPVDDPVPDRSESDVYVGLASRNVPRKREREGGRLSQTPVLDGDMDHAMPRFGLGTYTDDVSETADAVERALEVGYRHVDTAQSYDNERAVGEGLARAGVPREETFVATKLDTSNLGYDDALATARESADRLGVGTIDLLYVHWPIDTYDPDETLPALDALYEEGTIGAVGLSNFTPPLLREALDRLDAPVLAHQVECHPMLPQEELRSIAREEGHWLVAYSPIARNQVAEIEAIREMAEDHDATPAQVALAWLLAKERVAPIPKATGEHVEENWAARDVDLDPAAVERIDALEERRRLIDFEAAPWN